MNRIVPFRPPSANCAVTGTIESEWGDVVEVWASSDREDPTIFLAVWDDDEGTDSTAALTLSEAAQVAQLVSQSALDLARQVREA